jgi:hypothetical protein
MARKIVRTVEEIQADVKRCAIQKTKHQMWLTDKRAKELAKNFALEKEKNEPFLPSKDPKYLYTIREKETVKPL